MHSPPVPPCPETDVVVGEALIDIIDTAAGLELAQTSRKNSDD
jgi:hypothetical protein